MRTTPDHISELAANEIFVFGSNTAGRHGAGAALYARQYFGAEYGVGEGLTGKTYAFPSLDGKLQKRSTEELERSVQAFRICAMNNPEKVFLVTKIGCGLAGFRESEIAPLFTEMPNNVILPEGWSRIKIEQQKGRSLNA